MSTTTIADKLYVTIQYRGDASNTDGLLGFASPYEKNAKFEKRKVTQDRWAYGYGADITIADDESITVTGEGTPQYGGGGKWDASMLFIANCYPRIIKNEPVDGFQIAKSVRRSSGWNGAGNVVWRISDPRGFDLEIGSENFASILLCSTMINGTIQGKCVWGRDGAKNVLLPEASEPYQQALTQTKKVNSTVSLRDVQVGDEVEIISTTIPEEDHKCQYLGKYYFMQADSQRPDHGQPGSAVVSMISKQNERYLFKSLASQQYFTLSSPKISTVTTRVALPLDKHVVAKVISNTIADEQFALYDGRYSRVVLISPTKIDLSKVIVDIVPSTMTLGKNGAWPHCGKHTWRKKEAVVEYEGTKYLTTFRDNGHYSGKDNTLRLVKFTVDGAKINIPFVLHTDPRSNQGSGWLRSSYSYYKYNELLDADPTKFTFYRVAVVYGDIVGGTDSVL